MNGFIKFATAVLAPVKYCLHPLRVEGLEHVPQSGALLCPNHCSNWDPFLIKLALPVEYPLYTMAKDSLFHIPVLRWIIAKLGAFPVSRGNSDLQAMKTALQVLQRGDNLMIFPEGHRVSREGELPAKGGAAVIAIRTGAQMVPVYVEQHKRLFRPTRVIFGAPYKPVYTGRHGTAEEIQKIADTVLQKAYELGRAPWEK